MNKPNHVYVARNSRLGKSVVKIGCTADPIGREKSLSNSSVMGKFNLEVVAYVGEGNGRAVEQRIHDKFNNKRIEKEFFDVDIAEVRKYIQSLNVCVVYDPHIDNIVDVVADVDDGVDVPVWRDDDDNGLIGHNVRRYHGKFGWTNGVVSDGNDGLFRIRYGVRDDELVSIHTLRRILV